jgi:hypothetical protein
MRGRQHEDAEITATRKPVHLIQVIVRLLAAAALIVEVVEAGKQHADENHDGDRHDIAREEARAVFGPASAVHQLGNVQHEQRKGGDLAHGRRENDERDHEPRRLRKIKGKPRASKAEPQKADGEKGELKRHELVPKHNVPQKLEADQKRAGNIADREREAERVLNGEIVVIRHVQRSDLEEDLRAIATSEPSLTNI